jgi:hypothetical protein
MKLLGKIYDFLLSLLGVYLRWIVAPVIIVVVSAGAFINENLYVQTITGVREGLAAVTEADSSRVDPANQGRLVHLAGQVSTPQKQLTDPVFGLKVDDALCLRRFVEMYQWVKKRTVTTTAGTGSDYYEKDWGYVPPNELLPKGDLNTRFPFPEGVLSIVASPVQLGAFSVPERLLSEHKFIGMQTVELPATSKAAASKAAASKAGVGGYRRDGAFLYKGHNAALPELGDLRIHWVKLPSGPFSLLGMQSGSTLEPYSTSGGLTIFSLDVGLESANQTLLQSKSSGRAVAWIVRPVALFLMYVGFVMLLNETRLAGASGWLAVGWTLLVACTPWLLARQSFGLPLLVLGLGALWAARKNV